MRRRHIPSSVKKRPTDNVVRRRYALLFLLRCLRLLGQCHLEYGTYAIHVVLGRAVVVVDTVLLLLLYRQLRVAIAPDEIAHIDQHTHLRLQTLVEILLGLGGITVPLVVGYLAQGYGFAPALVYISAVALIGALSYILLVGDVKRVG